MNFFSDDYTTLSVLIRSCGQNKIIKVVNLKKQLFTQKETGNNQFITLHFELEPHQEFELTLPVDIPHFSYLHGCPNIFEKGIKLLSPETAKKQICADNLHEWYDTAQRDQFHFMQMKNWLNDPNGLCYFKGNYHLFYQSNPFAQKWNNMYWGHAVSKDLIHWVHLPFALEPQAELAQDPSKKGGAFSGSAVVIPDELDRNSKKMRCYLTRHFGNWQEETLTQEWQTLTDSRDGISFSTEKVIIRNYPEYADYDFRDPKVTKIGNWWYLVLGSRYNNIPSILLYTSQDGENWNFDGELLSEPEIGVRTLECPDFFLLNEKAVSVAALMCHSDKQGRYQGTRYYIGSFDGHKLQVESIGLYDFGSNFYAVQSFEHNGRRIAIGWISDFYQEYESVQNGSYGSMSIPRELQIKNGKLYMIPIAEIYQLQGCELYAGKEENIECIVSGSTAHLYFEITDDSDFEILLGENQLEQDKKSAIKLLRINGITCIKTSGVKSEHINFEAGIANVRNVEIFIDRCTVEVFLNKGEAVGAKLFFRSKKDCIISGKFKNPKAVSKLTVKAMNSAWKHKK